MGCPQPRTRRSGRPGPGAGKRPAALREGRNVVPGWAALRGKLTPARASTWRTVPNLIPNPRFRRICGISVPNRTPGTRPAPTGPYAKPRRAGSAAPTGRTSSPVPIPARPVKRDCVVVEVMCRGSGRRDAKRLVVTAERGARRGRHQTRSALQDFLPSLTSRPLWTGRAKGSGVTKHPLRRERLGGTRAPVPGHDGCPVGSLRRERQHRDRQASWRPMNPNRRKERHGRS